MSDGYEDHPGYSFEDASGRRHHVPALKVKARYRNESMSRDRAYLVAIAFGQETGLPIDVRASADGRGYNAVIPMEYLEGLFSALGKID